MGSHAALCLRIDADLAPESSAAEAAAIVRIVGAAKPGQRLQFCVGADATVACADSLRHSAQAGHGVDPVLDLPAAADLPALDQGLNALEAVYTQARVSWWGLAFSGPGTLPLPEQPAWTQLLMNHGTRWACQTYVSGEAPQPHMVADDLVEIVALPLLPDLDPHGTAAGALLAEARQHLLRQLEAAAQSDRILALACSLRHLMGLDPEHNLLSALFEAAAACRLPLITLNEIADVTLARHQAEPAARDRVSVEQHLQFRAYWDNVIGAKQQAYKVYDYRGGWRLKPGYYRSGPSGWEVLSEPEPERGYEINRHGFRGPMFPHAKPDGEMRVMVVGDSCVFGVAGREGPWPAQAQRRFDELAGAQRVRVINAGIEGQSSVHSLMRLKRLLTFEPDWVVVGVAGNDLFIENPADYLDTTGRAYATAWEVMGEYPRERDIAKVVGGERRPMTLETFYPYSYAYHLHTIVQQCRQAGARPALMTLPCLFPADLSLAGETHRRKMHSPPFVTAGDMPAMRRLYDCYNGAVQRVAAEAQADLIDGEGFFRRQFDDRRDVLFSDTCHPSVEGNVYLGRFVADTLWELFQQPRSPHQGD